MCKLCVEALKDIFPEVPDEESGDFLMSTTCFPFGETQDVRVQLLQNKAKMKTNDYKECYKIAERELFEAMKEYEKQEITEI